MTSLSEVRTDLHRNLTELRMEISDNLTKNRDKTDERMRQIQESNETRLEQMRQTVEEKLKRHFRLVFRLPLKRSLSSWSLSIVVWEKCRVLPEMSAH